ncbi:MAG: TIGR00730 family Rossman fold protein [Rhodospirillaceae bacterium]|jgi:hypothetical protein|nr:TIGR00730 family Rossman fold protein [Rhodospirillaceae bacterium]MBT5374623.1 TIGR00730 family Rossman fold protein [Rhodospirillaceae bacterium]MBT5751880.1 TIGR00730 family Rossman fold protein [Rhodospirillaceae bacterium]
MKNKKSLCVYCGSCGETNPAHREAAEQLGDLLAKNSIRLVYGGGDIGLMGILANAVLNAGGEVIGVLPRFLEDWEVEHKGLSQLIIVESMHARKQKMFELSDAFAVLPGGYGTLEELLEVLTWKQLKLHNKPVMVVDTDGYWQPLRALFEHIIQSGYADEDSSAYLTYVEKIESILSVLDKIPEDTQRPNAEKL